MDDALSHLLPDDPAALKAIIAAVIGQRDEASRQRDARDEQARRLQQRIDELEVSKLRLEVELLRLKKWYYGPRADRLNMPGDVAQMLLEFAGELEARPIDPADLPPEADASADGVGTDAAKSIRRVRRGRRNLAAFDHLPVTRNVHDLAEADKPCTCCGTMREPIGQDISWQVEFIPAVGLALRIGHFERIEHVRLKYACKHCEANAQNPQITLADKPTQPIEKGMAGPGLLAYVVTSKFADYLPLYRLENIFQRNGLEISRSTQCIWCRDVAELIEPLYRRMKERVLTSHLVCTDDTIMPMQAPEKAAKARMWVYIGDQANPYNLFNFTLNRGRDGPMTFLQGYKQMLLADAYGGYDGVVVGNDITRAGCWAHARRKFVDAEKAHPQIAAEAVGIIKRLYAIEERGKPMEVEQRTALRQIESVPILTALKDKLHGWRDQLLPKHPMSQAIGYTLNQWTELNVFAADGCVPIDNNISEREIKRVVLNRKNSLFVGSERGGHTAAILSSFTATAKRHGIDPQLYLTQLLTNLPRTPISQLDQWLPDVWKINQATRTP
jgi:transposase